MLRTTRPIYRPFFVAYCSIVRACVIFPECSGMLRNAPKRYKENQTFFSLVYTYRGENHSDHTGPFRKFGASLFTVVICIKNDHSV